MPKTFNDFPQFYQSPVIQSIALNKKWSVSTAKKMPIDIKELQLKNRFDGANYTDERSLVSLPELCEFLPSAANNAYFLDALIDNLLIIDIEPKCPNDLKQKLLQLPYEYGEISMSGNGYHLVFQLPRNFYDYPVATQKTVMKEEHGYYEILLNHWITFTRNVIQPAPKDASQADFEAFFAKIASTQKETIRRDIVVTDLEPATFPFKEKILELLMQQPYHKTLNDFNNDRSKFEYAFIGFLYYKLRQILNVSQIKRAHTYTDTEKAWLLYLVAKERLPYRSKHDEFRKNLPWLLHLATEVIAKNIASTQ